jgi:predicted MFS family arabinose efflux permease
LHHLLHTVSKPRYLQGFATTGLLTVGGFMIMPFMSPFTVHNLGIAIDRLPLIYMVTGAGAMIAGPLIGRLSDAVGKYVVFAFGCAATIIMVTIYTHLGITPLGVVMLVNVLLFIGVSSRMISASALVSAIPDAQDRGSYMSISSSMQQFAGGIAAAVGGLIVIQSPSGALQRFDLLGYLLSATTVISLSMMYFISRRVEGPVAVPASYASAVPANSIQHANNARSPILIGGPARCQVTPRRRISRSMPIGDTVMSRAAPSDSAQCMAARSNSAVAELEN